MKNFLLVLYTRISVRKHVKARRNNGQVAEMPILSVRKTIKILVVNAYVRENAGDAALLSVLLDQVAEAFPNSEIRVSGMENPQVFVEFEGKENLGSVRRWTSDEQISRLNRISRKMVGGLVELFWFRGSKKIWRLIEWCLPSEPRGELSALRTSDLIIGIGGGYMRGAKGIGGDFNVFNLLLPLVLAKRLKKLLVLAPQSYGPFSRKWQEKAVVHVLHNVDAVFVREDASMNLLTSLGAKPQRLERAADSGFAFESNLTRDWRSELSVNEKIQLVGITARQWLEPAAQARYEEALSLTVNHIQSEYGCRAVLIPQVMSKFQQDDDRIVQVRIESGCNLEYKPLTFTNLNGHHELKSIYSNLDFLVGTRFHSVIFALTSFVPCIAIEYEHKTGGIMRELGLERWVIPIEDVTAERLQSLFADLIREADAYRKHLRKVIPPYISRSRAFSEVLKQMGSEESLRVGIGESALPATLPKYSQATF